MALQTGDCMKFVTNDSWIGKDKNLHLIGCLVATFGVAAFSQVLLYGVIAGVTLALLKDVVYDGLLGKGTFSLQDIVVSFVGVGLGALGYYALMM
jgi:hypothetical protein